jgi:topoisomerase-4 subunit B
MATHNYTEASIRSLDWREHIRLRPGMYIGKLSDGSAYDDGIYVLLKEIIDNSIDEYVMGYGKRIDLHVTDHRVEVRDYGRGIPLGKIVDCVSKINTGGKYDSQSFQKSVGLNGVGTKAVNALSAYFQVQSFRGGQTTSATFKQGVLVEATPLQNTQETDGTWVVFEPDASVFKNFHFISQFIEEQLWNYAFLNAGLAIIFNGQKYVSKNGLLDLLERKTEVETLCYPIIHVRGEDIEIALTHNHQYGEEYYSFVNGQFTTQGGTHLAAFKETLVKTVRDFYKKDFEASDIRTSIVGAIAIRVQEPVFESQTKTKLGSQQIGPAGPTIRAFVNDFIKKELDDLLRPTPCSNASYSQKESAKRLQASKNWPTSGPKRPVYTTKNCVTAGCIMTVTTLTDMILRFSLPKAILPVALLPSRATCRPRPYFLCVASPSTALVVPRRWFTKTRSSTCFSMHLILRTV